MALAPRLDLRQSQSLVMTPQLQQAIKLLALSNIEIEAWLAGELERNPLLELARGDGSDGEGAPADAVPEREGAAVSSAEAGSDAMMRDDAVMAESPLDVESGPEEGADRGLADPDMAGGAGLSGAGGLSDDYPLSGGFGEDGPDFDSFASGETGLYEHLMDQARLRFSGRELLIASQIIGQIDEAGYLEAELLPIAYALQVPLIEVEAVLAVIQGFDPVGVAARSLSECLALQAKEADRYDPAMAALLANLDLLARGALPQLRRICGVDEEDLADMIRELRAYDPKPGLRFAAPGAGQAVIPDIFVTPRGKGWGIEINGATLPRLLVNRVYYAELSGGVQDKASKAWLADCLASANWLIRALDQRQRTIIKVATEIVRQQEEFFRHGIAHLRPMTLRSVAEAIGMHESTVSRVTSNKYLSCPRGLFELKYFFTSAIASAAGGEAVSAEAVKSRIKALIAAEDPRKILSDDTLVDLLRAEGFDIARRTVAKYRESMGIGSSVQRRRQKALAG
ncbi:RNA polymerase sigma-54 factor 2 [Sphingobium jiangsuense]|uniref:RNA polymerase sigma-54 factor n=1 Tax=Sphingobium jiangsuense TaxID=870476 RepID=A0A7W6BNT3_9SPHN|nr:RNA polymerase factor sigma-54 [Sphingobium jiangsuense]MBB3927265.1 RNA polymerase sigma-54 factor [Sphingobium jiangsuense]GLT02645.1 RNA polymerase sigma-54 factor 2 [Sphingobium jiangsuense]